MCVCVCVCAVRGLNILSDVSVLFVQRHGHGLMVYEDQSEYQGEWKMGLRHGEGSWRRKDGICYSGMWEFDQPHGKGDLENEKTKYKYTG